MSFRVGQEVVCIKDKWTNGRRPFIEPGDPVKGGVYVIEKIEFDVDFQCEGLDLVGCPGFYAASHFRPIVKTDISIFTAMLAPSPKQRVDADA